jgi:RES domain-containing protein
MPVKVLDALSGVAYRAVSPVYYHNGLSPEGARDHAGRFNRKGLSALYIGLDADTAIKEYYGSDTPTPLVLLPIAYELRHVIDLTGILKGWPRDWQKWNTAWRKALSSPAPNPDCASWRCGDDAVDRRCSGILYPSQYNPSGQALALFPERATLGSCTLSLMDPMKTILAANPPKS